MKITVETHKDNEVSTTRIDLEGAGYNIYDIYRNSFVDRKILATELIKGAFELLATCPDTMSELDDLYDTITTLEDQVDG